MKTLLEVTAKLITLVMCKRALFIWSLNGQLILNVHQKVLKGQCRRVLLHQLVLISGGGLLGES